MSEGVVDLGQHVEFDQQDGAAPTLGDGGLALDVQTEPVAQPSDGVVVGLVPQRFQQPEIVQRGGHVTAEGLEQLQVLVPEPAPSAQPIADLEVATVPVAGAQRNDQHVPGLAFGQRRQHLRVGTAIRRCPRAAGDPGRGEQRVVLPHRRLVQHTVRADRQRAQGTVTVVQPQHTDFCVQLVAHLLQHAAPVVDRRADIGDLPAEAVHPGQVGVLAQEQEVGPVENGEHAGEGDAHGRAERAGLPDGEAGQRERHDRGSRQHGSADDPGEWLGRSEQPVGEPDRNRGHQRAGQHTERDGQVANADGGRRLIGPDDGQHDERRGARLDRDEGQVDGDVAPAVPADQENQRAGSDVRQADRPGGQQQQPEHHRQLGPADQQGFPTDLDL